MSRKRGNGEGSITKRREGRWMARYTIHTIEGPKRKTLYAKTRAEAAAKLAKALAERDGGVAFDASRMTFGAYLERWLSDAVRDTVKERTLMRYEQVCRLHLAPTLGCVRLPKLKSAHFQALYKSKMDEGLSSSTVRGIHVVANKAMKQALRWDLVSRNPVSNAQAPRSEDAEVTPLSRDQAKRLLAALATEGDRLEAFYAVALATGLRIGELLGLRWQDVVLDPDLSGGELRVRRTLVRTRPKREGYAGYAFDTPKGGKGRSVRFKGGTARHLRSHKARQGEEKLRLGADYADSEQVFTKEVGGILPPWEVWRHFAKLLHRSGLPTVPFHTLRHTAATLMLENGEHPKVVQEILGHANISQTLGTYSHVTPNMQSEAAERLDTVLF